MRSINKVKLFSNHTSYSKPIEEELLKLLQEYNFEISEDFDLGIAIGGDGSFLQMVKQTNFNSKVPETLLMPRQIKKGLKYFKEIKPFVENP